MRSPVPDTWQTHCELRRITSGVAEHLGESHASCLFAKKQEKSVTPTRLGLGQHALGDVVSRKLIPGRSKDELRLGCLADPGDRLIEDGVELLVGLVNRKSFGEGP